MNYGLYLSSMMLKGSLLLMCSTPGPSHERAILWNQDEQQLTSAKFKRVIRHGSTSEVNANLRFNVEIVIWAWHSICRSWNSFIRMRVKTFAWGVTGERETLWLKFVRLMQLAEDESNIAGWCLADWQEGVDQDFAAGVKPDALWWCRRRGETP